MTQAKWIAALIIACGSSGAFGQQNQPASPPKPPTAKRVAFSPDGKSLAVAHSVVNSVEVWDVAARKRKFVVKENSSISDIAYSPQGNILAIATDKLVKLLDPATGEERRDLAGHNDSVRCLAFAPDGKQLASGSADRSVIFWDIASGEALRSMLNFPGVVTGVAISPDGKLLATSCGEDNDAKLWEISQLEQLPRQVVTPQQGTAQRLVFSADSRYVAAPNNTGSLPLIDTASGKECRQITDLGGTSCAAFSLDNRWLAIVRLDAIVLLAINRAADDEQQLKIAELISQFNEREFARRDAASKQLATLGSMALPQLSENLESASAEVRMRCRRLIERLDSAESAIKLIAQNSEPIYAAFSPDSKILADGDWQGTVKLWDVATAKEIATLKPN